MLQVWHVQDLSDWKAVSSPPKKEPDFLLHRVCQEILRHDFVSVGTLFLETDLGFITHERCLGFRTWHVIITTEDLKFNGQLTYSVASSARLSICRKNVMYL